MEGPDEDDDYNDRYSDSNGSSSDHSVENNNINNTPQLSVSSRLNPKLTKRNPASSMDKTFGEDEDEDVDIQNDNENNSVEMEYSVDSMTNSSVVPSKKVNPRLHLMHNGQWIPKKVKVILIEIMVLFEN